ncbi:MAG: ABC1 kinase family protein [Pseudobdellovibrionaceae bacterium]
MSSSEATDQVTMAERMRMSFEELGPTFVKLGQLLATRPDLVPESFVDEFSKLHDRVLPLPFETIESVLKEEFGEDFSSTFKSIERVPVGSASIAQVHKAILVSGEEVVIKVQRPGIVATINEDLSVLYFVSELLEIYIPELKPFNPVGIVNEFFKTLELETNFVVEANNIRRFHENFKNEPSVVIPKVYMDLTTERVLVLEALAGEPISAEGALKKPGVDPNQLIRAGLKAYLKMVFKDALFHGDLHAGNFFVMSNNRIGMIDFGVVGRLNKKTQTGIASMMVALATEDYERLAHEYVDISPYSDRVEVDLFAKQLRDLIAPFFGLTMKNVNMGRVLMSSASIAARQGLIVPTELMLFFKSMITIEGLGRRIQDDFDFLTYSLEFAQELVKTQHDPTRFLTDVTEMGRDTRSLVQSLPRQLKYLLRKWNSPEYAAKIRILELQDLKRAVETSSNILFLGLVIGSLLLGGSYLHVNQTGPYLWNIPVMSTVFLLSALFLSMLAFYNYFKK